MSNEVESLKWLWTVMSLPLAWIWHRLNKAHIKCDETRITLAERHYTKLEVQDLVDRSVGPLHSKLNDISQDIKYLIKEHREK